MKNTLKRLWTDEDGATAIEYGLIAGLISIVIVVSAPGIGTRLAAIFARILAAFPA